MWTVILINAHIFVSQRGKKIKKRSYFQPIFFTLSQLKISSADLKIYVRE